MTRGMDEWMNKWIDCMDEWIACVWMKWMESLTPSSFTFEPWVILGICNWYINLFFDIFSLCKKNYYNFPQILLGTNLIENVKKKI
jgi:hypothetical protein